MNANSISVHNLRKRFPGFLLDDISFQVPCGRIVGFIGENGAGKSTTIKLILDQLRRDGILRRAGARAGDALFPQLQLF